MGSRFWCQSCGRYVNDPELADGKQCCSFCGRVLSEDNWSNDPQWAKDSGGQSRAQGTLNNLARGNSDSRERTLQRGYEGITWIFLSVCKEDDQESILKPAERFYRIAVERNFTKGRSRDLVSAACLYISCRTKNKPYLLIDFAEFLNTNVYELGAVYLMLCQLLSLNEHEYVQKPVDPSLFIHRFSHKLLRKKDDDVTSTALKIISSMKRDWMQTGRKPSGLCGAAIYISALSHGHKCTKSQIVNIVHICEATLTKRLIEFENTESGSLTIEEFTRKAVELEAERKSVYLSASGIKSSEDSEVLCEHKDMPVFAHGLCGNCYKEFVEISGGLDGGLEPPAFQRAEQERVQKECLGGNADDSIYEALEPRQSGHHSNYEKKLGNQESSRDEHVQCRDHDKTVDATEHVDADHDGFDKLHDTDKLSGKSSEECETLSDIDDLEVDIYIHNEEEKRFKKIIWEDLNREYVEEQKVKEAAATAERKAYEASFGNCPEGMEDARKLAADAAAAVAKSRKERQQKRAAESRNSVPAQTAADATRQMLAKKRLESKINYDVLDDLFNDSNVKKRRVDNLVDSSKTEEKHKDSKLGSIEDEDEDVAEDLTEGYTAEVGYGNVEEGYDYDDDYGFEDY